MLIWFWPRNTKRTTWTCDEEGVVLFVFVRVVTWAHLVEDKVSDKHEEESRHESGEQGGDEPWRNWKRRRTCDQKTTATHLLTDQHHTHTHTAAGAPGSPEWVRQLSFYSCIYLFIFPNTVISTSFVTSQKSGGRSSSRSCAYREVATPQCRNTVVHQKIFKVLKVD